LGCMLNARDNEPRSLHRRPVDDVLAPAS
jgi:hypothetical protein